MTDFISGKLGARGVASGAARQPSQLTIAIEDESSAGRFVPTRPLVFSEAARAVFTAGRALWRYYHAQPGANPDASYYDIREHFQGRNAKGRMNAASQDTRYTELLAALRNAMGRPPRRANTFTLRLPGRAVWGKRESSQRGSAANQAFFEKMRLVWPPVSPSAVRWGHLRLKISTPKPGYFSANLSPTHGESWGNSVKS